MEFLRLLFVRFLGWIWWNCRRRWRWRIHWICPPHSLFSSSTLCCINTPDVVRCHALHIDRRGMAMLSGFELKILILSSIVAVVIRTRASIMTITPWLMIVRDILIEILSRMRMWGMVWPRTVSIVTVSTLRPSPIPSLQHYRHGDNQVILLDSSYN